MEKAILRNQLKGYDNTGDTNSYQRKQLIHHIEPDGKGGTASQMKQKHLSALTYSSHVNLYLREPASPDRSKQLVLWLALIILISP